MEYITELTYSIEERIETLKENLQAINADMMKSDSVFHALYEQEKTKHYAVIKELESWLDYINESFQ